MQTRNQRGQGRGSDARTPLGTRVEIGKTRGQVPLRTPDPQGERGTRVGSGATRVPHGQGAHVVDARAAALDDGQGGSLAHGCLCARFLPASAQSLTETQIGERSVRLVHGGCDVGAGSGRT